jgi:hypothetical protein
MAAAVRMAEEQRLYVSAVCMCGLLDIQIRRWPPACLTALSGVKSNVNFRALHHYLFATVSARRSALDSSALSSATEITVAAPVIYYMPAHIACLAFGVCCMRICGLITCPARRRAMLEPTGPARLVETSIATSHGDNSCGSHYQPS